MGIQLAKYAVAKFSKSTILSSSPISTFKIVDKINREYNAKIQIV